MNHQSIEHAVVVVATRTCRSSDRLWHMSTYSIATAREVATTESGSSTIQSTLVRTCTAKLYHSTPPKRSLVERVEILEGLLDTTELFVLVFDLRMLWQYLY